MGLLELGITAAFLQTIGYITYGWKVLRRDIEPNATSWLMFAYGTTLLTIVEWDRGATLPLLILPIVCAMLSVGIAIYCVRKARRLWWPDHVLERFSFLLDISLTILYIFSWILVDKSIISDAAKEWAEVLILVCWNIGVFTAFFPLLRQVYHHPRSEHPLPWYIWTLSYTALAYITYSEIGTINELMLYPLTHIIVHAAVGIHTGYAHFKYQHSII